MVIVHVGLLPQPAQSPPHPTKTRPGSGVAVNVIVVPSAKVALHAEPPVPQFIPAGLEVIVPFVGGEGMENVRATLKLAVHVLLAVIVMVHVVFVPQPAQSPPHPAKA